MNAVLPGPTRTEGVVEFLEKMAKERGIDMKAMESELIKTLRPSSLIKRMATPEEVAKAIYFLCTEQSSYVHGAEIHINGGQHV